MSRRLTFLTLAVLRNLFTVKAVAQKAQVQSRVTGPQQALAVGTKIQIANQTNGLIPEFS